MRALRSPQNLLIVVGYGLGAAALSAGLPEQIPPLWNVSGRGALWCGGPMVAFLLPTAVAVTNVLLRGREWADQIVPVMLGLTMISIGNLLPRTRPNLAIGIRTPRTLSDRALWIRMHRSAGYMVVALGV